MTFARMAGADAHEQRECGEPCDLRHVATANEITIEEKVAFETESAFGNVHQEEGEVIEYVDCRQVFVELERVGKRRLATDDDDVAQVKIAMTAPHIALGCPLSQHSGNAVELLTRPRDQGGNAEWIEQGRCLLQAPAVLFNKAVQNAWKIEPESRRRTIMSAGDCRCNAFDETWRQAT